MNTAAEQRSALYRLMEARRAAEWAAFAAQQAAVKAKRQADSIARKEASKRYVHWSVVLGVPRTCDMAELKAAWRAAAIKHHPDRGGSVEDFLRVKLAYEAACKVCQHRTEE